MLTMNTKEFRSILREAGVSAWQVYINKCVNPNARNVGVMLSNSNGQNELKLLTDAMIKHGHDPKAHNMRVCDKEGFVYIRGVAKFDQ